MPVNNRYNLGKLEQRVEFMGTALERLESKLDKLVDTMANWHSADQEVHSNLDKRIALAESDITDLSGRVNKRDNINTVLSALAGLVAGLRWLVR